MARQYTIYDCHLIGNQRQGQCLSPSYCSFRSKLKWMCNKHKVSFEAALSEVFEGKWCEQCRPEKAPVIKKVPSSNSMMFPKNIYEKCYVALLNLTNKEFEPSKPRWLYGLELDGYNVELEIAYIVKTINCYEAMLDKGDFSPYIEYLAKKEFCMDNDVTLIEVPYWVENVEDFISDKLDS